MGLSVLNLASLPGSSRPGGGVEENIKPFLSTKEGGEGITACDGDITFTYYKNNGEIKWSNDLHEKLEGPNPDKVAMLEAKPLIALWHIKTVERQDRQRAYYESL